MYPPLTYRFGRFASGARRAFLVATFALSAVLSFVPSSARADGIIIPEPPICLECPPLPLSGTLDIRNHHVTVSIEDQIAITRVDQVFYNPNEFTVEGTYLFPLPKEATVTNFKLWIDGSPVEGEVLSAEQARQTYEEIVRQMIDPALLEYVDRGAVQARIFPIDPGAERRIELEYSQVLQAENGLVRYAYPLNTEKFSRTPLEQVTIRVDIQSGTPIRAAYSPSHDIGISRESSTHILAGYEAKDVRPDSDFVLYYSLGETEAFHLLTYRNPNDPADPDGFYLLLLAPRPDTAIQVLPKDVLLVLDRSGSMDGEKYRQAQEALAFILENLNPEDRFNIIAFSTGLETYARGLSPASESARAIDWVRSSRPLGSTDINRALLEALGLLEENRGDRPFERPAFIIFLTDGLPTEGVIDRERILENFAAQAPDNIRLFTFGVGYDVDTFLLDLLAQNHHGASTYVAPGERIDEIVSGFYAKVSTPVLTDLQLDFAGVTVFDDYPAPLPDLFVGSQIISVGRYRDGGSADVTLTGIVNGEQHSFTYPEQVFDRRSEINDLKSAIPRLWATRKIGHLLSQIRLHGPDQETVDQVVSLSIRYGIVTPYTSYLVTEPDALGADQQERIVEEAFAEAEAAPTQVSGEAAVQRASEQGALEDADTAAANPVEAAERVKVLGSRTYLNVEGVWVDTAFDPDRMTTTRVAFLSDDYFTLAHSRPELGAAFALGPRVIAFSDGVAYEVVSDDAQVEPLGPFATRTPLPPADETPVSPDTQTTPKPTDVVLDSQSSAPLGLTCLGLLLPLFLLPLGLIWRRMGP